MKILIKHDLVAGDTLKIPDSVMGITFLAAGTSVPEAVSSVIVAKQGIGHLQLCNSPNRSMTFSLKHRPRINGDQQFDRIQHVRHIVVPWSTMADQIIIFANATWPPLHQHKFRGLGIQRYIIIIDSHVTLHSFCLEQISIGHKGGWCMPLHVRRIPCTRFVNRTQRIFHGEFANLSKDGQVIKRFTSSSRYFIYTSVVVLFFFSSFLLSKLIYMKVNENSVKFIEAKPTKGCPRWH